MQIARLEEIGFPPPREKYQSDLIYVYFVQASEHGHIKIGSARDIEKRIKTLSCGTWEELVLVGWQIGTVKIEFQIQRLFQDERIVREWFAPTMRLGEFICGAAHGRMR